MKYTLDSVRGGPKLNRKPLVIHKTALEKLAAEQNETDLMWKELKEKSK